MPTSTENPYTIELNPIEYNESESLEEAIVSLINIAKADLSEGETFRPDDLDLKIYR